MTDYGQFNTDSVARLIIERNALAKRVEELVEQNRRVQTNFTTAVERVEELEDTLRVLHSFAKEVVEEFDCDCREDYYEPGEKCFWCKAKEALGEKP